jgi:hypothetical protein
MVGVRVGVGDGPCVGVGDGVGVGVGVKVGVGVRVGVGVDVGVGVSVGVEVAKKATMVLAVSALTHKPMPQSKLPPPSSKATRKQPNAEKDDFAERGRAVGTERCG